MLLKVYDQYKNIVGNIRKYTDLVIERELESGDKTLSFTYQEKNPELIQNEYYIETPDDRYVVKEIGISSDGYPEIVCQLDLETLEADMVESFSAVEVSIQEAANLALVGTGWLADTEGMDPEKLRSVATLKATPLTILGKIRDAWMCELKYDSKNQVVYFRDQFGEDKGVFFSKELNLRKLKLTDDSYDYYTRIVPIGEDDLRIDDVNDGVGYVENYQYSDKIKTLIWEDTSYTDAEALKEDAEAKLDDMSKPARSYSADVVDLAKEKPEYKIMDFDLGDTITLLDQDSGIKDKQRIVKLKEYPDDPYKNTCELSNTTWTWEELQSKLQAAADAFEDITNSDGSVNGYYVHGLTSDGVLVVEKVLNPDGTTTTEVIGSLTDNIQIIGQQSQEAYDAAVSVVGDIVTINGELDVVYERVGTLEATSLTVTEADIRYASIEDLDVTTENVENLYALYAEIQSAILDEAAIRRLIVSYGYITEADIETLRTTVAEIQSAYISYEEVQTLLAGYASIDDLDAITINVETLYGDVANIVTVLSGEIGTGLLESIHLTTDNAIIDEAVIVTALMDTVLASVLTAGIIYTDYIKIADNEGQYLWIDGSTLQFKDENGIVRVQIGLDESGNYNYYLFGEDGTLLWDPLGLTEAGLIGNGAIIKDEAVADDANISGYKLNIDEVTQILNEEGRLELDAAQITIDGEQLDYKLTQITQDVNALASDSIVDVINYYALGGPDEPPCDPDEEIIPSILGEMVLGETKLGCIGWTTERLVADEGEYLWFVQKIVYADGTWSWTTPSLLTDDYLRERTTVLTTELSVVQGQIEAKIWLADIETATNSLGDQINTISEQYSDLTVTIDTIDERVGTLTTTVASNYEELSSEVSSITTQIGDINIEVNSVYSYIDSEISTVSEQLADIDVKLGEIDIQVSDLDTYTTENISYLLEQYAGITVELGQVTTRVENVEQLAIRDVTPYYAVSGNPDWYPPHEVDEDEVAILGEMILGKAVLGVSGDDWTEEQPDAEDDRYIWVSYLITLIDGSEWWTEPTLLTDDRVKQRLSQLTEQYAEIVVSLDGINLTLYSLQADSESMLEQITEIDMELGSMSFTVYDSGSGMASIVMTVGDKTSEADVVTNAREAFEAEDSTIEITAGLIKFLSNSLVIYSTQLTLDEEGNLIIDTPQLSIDADGNLTINTTQFVIDENGDATFSGNLNAATGTFTGELVAATGTFSGALEAATGTFSGELVAATGTFSGELVAASGTFSGALEAATGSFSGELIAATGTFSGSLEAATGTFSGSLDAATGTFSGSLVAATGTFSGELVAASGSFKGDVTATSFTVYDTINIYNSQRGTTDTITGYYNSETYGIQIGTSGHIVVIPAELSASGGVAASTLSVDRTSTFSGAATFNSTIYAANIYFQSYGTTARWYTTWGYCGIASLSAGTTLALYSQLSSASSWSSSVTLVDSDGNVNLVPKTGGTFTGSVTTSNNLTANGGYVTVYNSPYGISLTASDAGNEGLYDNPVSATSAGWILRFVRNTSSDNAGATFLPQVPTYSSTTGTANMRMGSSGQVYYLTGSSSIRYKDIIGEMQYSEIEKYYDLPVHWFTYKTDYVKEGDERYMVPLPGFIAEEWNDLLPAAVDHDGDGQCEVWNPNFVVPLMFEMIKNDHSIIVSTRDDVDELKQQLEAANERIAKLEKQIAA